MGIFVTEYTKSEQAAYKENHPMSEPKRYAVIDDGIVYSFYDTEEAGIMVEVLQEHDHIRNEFLLWLHKSERRHPLVKREEFYSIVKSVI